MSMLDDKYHMIDYLTSPEYLVSQMEKALRESILNIQRSVLCQRRAAREAKVTRLYQDQQIAILRWEHAG